MSDKTRAMAHEVRKVVDTKWHNTPFARILEVRVCSSGELAALSAVMENRYGRCFTLAIAPFDEKDLDPNVTWGEAASKLEELVLASLFDRLILKRTKPAVVSM